MTIVLTGGQIKELNIALTPIAPPLDLVNYHWDADQPFLTSSAHQLSITVRNATTNELQYDLLLYIPGIFSEHAYPTLASGQSYTWQPIITMPSYTGHWGVSLYARSHGESIPGFVLGSIDIVSPPTPEANIIAIPEYQETYGNAGKSYTKRCTIKNNGNAAGTFNVTWQWYSAYWAPTPGGDSGTLATGITLKPGESRTFTSTFTLPISDENSLVTAMICAENTCSIDDIWVKGTSYQ